MNKLHLFAAALGLLITTAAVGLTTYAATTTEITAIPPRFAEHQAIRQAMIDGDYDAWKAAMEQKISAMRTAADDLERTITQETFNKLGQVHQLIEDGKVDEARALSEELGIGFGMHGHGMHKGFRLLMNAPVNN